MGTGERWRSRAITVCHAIYKKATTLWDHTIDHHKRWLIGLSFPNILPHKTRVITVCVKFITVCLTSVYYILRHYHIFAYYSILHHYYIWPQLLNFVASQMQSCFWMSQILAAWTLWAIKTPCIMINLSPGKVTMLNQGLSSLTPLGWEDKRPWEQDWSEFESPFYLGRIIGKKVWQWSKLQ